MPTMVSFSPRRITQKSRKESLHQAYRQARSKFYSKRKLRQMRIRDGGSPPTKNGWSKMANPPYNYDVGSGLFIDNKIRRYSRQELRAMHHGVFKWEQN